MKILGGKPQIVYSVAQAQKVVELVRSSANGVCFCVGTFAEAQEDCPAAIRALGTAIKFVHFRDVVSEVKGEKFREAWQDSGDTDMPDVIRALKEIGFDGPIRPDHVPTLEGEVCSFLGARLRCFVPHPSSLTPFRLHPDIPPPPAPDKRAAGLSRAWKIMGARLHQGVDGRSVKK